MAPILSEVIGIGILQEFLFRRIFIDLNTLKISLNGTLGETVSFELSDGRTLRLRISETDTWVISLPKNKK
ncbi:hypothetical protein TDIS_2164 [Thermosulfurimonas dismutans]|uniref:Uncharacterized protein n=1 Tax=Thermosulfurimonas dismutans TaxID=999894 RepID=A0A179D113_9BACT|nr:hypothetical protein TDIS_2164 [Thermosulfurimonas dismutans]